MLDTEEVAYTLEHLRTVLENLVVKGLGSTTADQISSLSAIREECERIGAYYLSESIATVVNSIQNGSNTAAGALMKTQATVRVFERVLTLENAAERLELVLSVGEEVEEDDDDVDESE
ncbi:MAG: hypothetical protein K2Z81_25390 [Cyanobacteria bacterium]|nr:hypothetical protein [Cyanobacteriota bacterium]